MQNEHSCERGQPAITITGPAFIAQYGDGVLRLRLRDKPDRDIARINADSFVKLPHMLPLIYERLAKDVTLSGEIRDSAEKMACRTRYAMRIRIPPWFHGESVAKKVAELFGPDQATDEPDVTISREDLKVFLAHFWAHAEEDFIFTPFDDQAGHVFPKMVQLFEVIAGPNEQLRQFVEDCLSEEANRQVTESVRNV